MYGPRLSLLGVPYRFTVFGAHLWQKNSCNTRVVFNHFDHGSYIIYNCIPITLPFCTSLNPHYPPYPNFPLYPSIFQPKIETHLMSTTAHAFFSQLCTMLAGEHGTFLPTILVEVWILGFTPIFWHFVMGWCQLDSLKTLFRSPSRSLTCSNKNGS